MRKSGFLWAISVILGLGACQAAGAKNVTVEFGTGKSAVELKIIEKLISEFQQLNPGIKVKLESYSGGFREKLLMQFVTGKAPDVFETGLEDFPLYPKSGYLYPLDQFMSKADARDFPKQLLKTFSYQGKLYGLTRDVAPLVMFYNRKMFSEMGVPIPDKTWTWDAYTTVLKKFAADTNGDGRNDRFGFAGGPWENLVWQAGGDIYDDEVRPKKITLDSPQALAGLQFMVDMGQKFGISPRTSDMSLFVNNKAATAIGGYWQRINDMKSVKFQWDAAPVPMGKERATIMYSASFSMNKLTKHPVEAYKWLEFLCSARGQREMAQLGLAVPSRYSLAKDIISKNSPPDNGEAFIDAIEYGRLAYHYGFRKPTESINNALNKVWTGKMTPQQAIAGVASEVNSALARIR